MDESNTILPAHRELIQSLIDGTLEPIESQRVNALLRNDIVLREFYIRQLRTDEQICSHFEEADSPVLLNHPESHVSKRKHYTAIAVSITVGMAAAIALMLTFWKSDPVPSQDDSHYSQFIPAPDRTPIARVSGVKDVVWAKSSGDLLPGHWLSAGKLELKKGIIELSYDSGSTVLVKAPAVYYIEDQNRGFLEKGSIRAHSPKTVAAFEIETPNAQLIDLGTTFGVTVAGLLSTEVHVLEGLVKVRSITDLNKPWKHLLKGKAMRISSNDEHETEYTPMKANTSYYAWEPPARAERQTVPEYAHWTFDSMQGEQFPETGNHTGEYRHHAAIVDFSKNPHGYSWMTPGQFGKALRLDGNSRFLRTDYPAIEGSKARTVAFWLRLGKKQPATEGLAGVVSWGENNRRGAKWQVLPFTPLLGKKQKVIRTECAWGHSMGSTDINDGKWHHIVSIFMGGDNADVATHTKHYVDGKLEARGSMISRRVNTTTTESAKTNFPVVIGITMQGGQATSLEHIIRSYRIGRLKNDTLNADIDELYIFDAALTSREILELMEKNKVPE